MTERGSRDAATLATLEGRLRSVFPRASEASVGRLIEAHQSRVAEPGFVDQAASSGPEVLLVLDGHVAASQPAPDGRLALLGVFEAGGLIGLATLDGDPPQVGLEALDRVVLATWPTRRIREIAEQDPGMTFDIVELLVHRLRTTLALLEKRTFATASARLASALLQHEALVFDVWPPRIPRSQLATLAGVSREMTGRILRRWEGAGIVSRTGRTLHLLDRQRLEDEAAGADNLAAVPRLPSGIAS